MADRTVSVRLVADAQAYIRGVEAAERKTREATQTVEQQLAKQREAYNTVGVAAVAVGAAITGIGIAALKTGIEYNTLQQTTRAALSTLLGSAEAANAQMDRLDEFARNSPFSKQVFIEAQQQLLGFGMEAERVVPTLDAIQNAVAATGGSNQDIAELVRIIAQLEGGVKISAETFNQFGARGIDAAQLIGDAMGKTGEQIRSEVTAGTLDADAAIRALTDGMQARFSGAADGVKDTFEGAMDRVKAAWRDFASELARPLVNPDGGGMLVDILNWAADAMRAFEGLPGPVKASVTGITGLIGVVALAGGTFMLAVPQIAAFNAALDTLELRNSRLVRGVSGTAKFLTGPWALSFGAAVLAVGALNAALANLHATEAEFKNALSTGGSDTIANLLSEGIWNSESKESAELVLGALDQIGNAFENTVTSAFSFSNASRLKQNLAELDTALSALSFEEATAAMDAFGESVGATPEQFETMLEQMPQFRDRLYGIADALGVGLEDMQDWERQLWLAEAASGRFTDANGDLVEAAHLVTDAVDGTVTALSEQEIAAMEAASALESLSEALGELGNDYMTGQEALRAYNDEIRQAEETIAGLGDVSLDAAGNIDTMNENGSVAEATLFGIAQQAIDTAQTMVDLDGDIEGANEVMNDARDKAIEMAMSLGLSRDEAARLADSMGLTKNSVDNLRAAMALIENVDVDVSVDTVAARIAVDNFIAQQSNRRIILAVDAAGRDRIIQPGQVGVNHSGGRLPGYSPGYDDHLAVTAGGYVTGLAGGEWIINPVASRKYDEILRQINAGTFPGYANGGRLAAPSYSSSSSSVFNITVDQTINTASGVDAEGVARIGANRAVAAVAEYLGGR